MYGRLSSPGEVDLKRDRTALSSLMVNGDEQSVLFVWIAVSTPASLSFYNSVNTALVTYLRLYVLLRSEKRYMASSAVSLALAYCMRAF